MALRAFSLGAIATSFVGCFLSMVEEFNEFLRSLQQPPPSTLLPHSKITLPASAAEAVVAEEVAWAVAPVVEAVEEEVVSELRRERGWGCAPRVMTMHGLRRRSIHPFMDGSKGRMAHRTGRPPSPTPSLPYSIHPTHPRPSWPTPWWRAPPR